MWIDTFNDMRRRSGLSLDELSEKSGVPKGTLAKITSGVTKAPALETIRSLVYAMGYTLDDLYNNENAPSKLHKLSDDEIELIKYYSQSSPDARKLLRDIASYTAHAASTGYVDRRISAEQRVLDSLARQAGFQANNREVDEEQHG